jgi:hypothetical protein
VIRKNLLLRPSQSQRHRWRVPTVALSPSPSWSCLLRTDTARSGAVLRNVKISFRARCTHSPPIRIPKTTSSRDLGFYREFRTFKSNGIDILHRHRMATQPSVCGRIVNCLLRSSKSASGDKESMGSSNWYRIPERSYGYRQEIG